MVYLLKLVMFHGYVSHHKRITIQFFPGFRPGTAHDIFENSSVDAEIPFFCPETSWAQAHPEKKSVFLPETMYTGCCFLN